MIASRSAVQVCGFLSLRCAYVCLTVLLDTCPIVQYIYISTEEMKAVAEYIKRRGRIAIGELAAKSNTFIDLEAKATAVSFRLAPSSNHLFCIHLL